MRLTSKRVLTSTVVLTALVAIGGLAVDAGPRKRATGPVVAHHVGGKKIGAASARIENIKVWDHSAEPTLGVNPGGDVFYVAADLDGDEVANGRRVPNQVHVFRSEDEGDSWTDVSPMAGPVRRHAVTLDPYILVDELPDGDTARIFNIDLTVACSYLSYSDDNGQSWLTNPLACGRPVNDHQTLFAGPPASSTTIGYPHLVYYCWNDVATSSCTKSLDGGITFHPTGSPAFAGIDDGSLCGGLHGHGVVGADGTVLLPREYCDRPYLAISKDEGRSWTTVQVSKMETNGNDPSVAVDDKGNIYYLFVGADDRLPYLVYSRNDGKSWSKPVMVGAPGLREANLATLDVGDPGKVAIAYMGSTNVKITKSKDPDEADKRDHLQATWNAYLTASVDVFDRNPTFITGQVNDSDDPIKRQTCGPGRCGRVFDFIDVFVSPDGTPWAAFTDACVADCVSKGFGEMGDEAFIGHLVGGPKLQ